jgi:hypothetical protein
MSGDVNDLRRVRELAEMNREARETFTHPELPRELLEWGYTHYWYRGIAKAVEKARHYRALRLPSGDASIRWLSVESTKAGPYRQPSFYQHAIVTCKKRADGTWGATCTHMQCHRLEFTCKHVICCNAGKVGHEDGSPRSLVGYLTGELDDDTFGNPGLQVLSRVAPLRHTDESWAVIPMKSESGAPEIETGSGGDGIKAGDDVGSPDDIGDAGDLMLPDSDLGGGCSGGPSQFRSNLEGAGDGAVIATATICDQLSLLHRRVGLLHNTIPGLEERGVDQYMLSEMLQMADRLGGLMAKMGGPTFQDPGKGPQGPRSALTGRDSDVTFCD